MNIFDILGPVMVGPSSSHTAGAVRIGYVAKYLLQDTPQHVKIFFYGSFASTGTGHGTDRAVVAGLLGMKPDDIRIPDSFNYAKKAGLNYSFHQTELKNSRIPADQVIDAMKEIGDKMDASLKETGLGGLAATAFGKEITNKII